MLRRVLLLAALLAPLSALGQAISINPSSPYTKAECDSTTDGAILNWSIPAGTTIPTDATYRILVSTTSECSDAASPTIVASGIAPDKTGGDPTGATNQRYPKAGDPVTTLTVNTFFNRANVTCGSNPTVYTCVQLIQGTVILAKSNILQLQVQDGPPSVPVNVFAAAGEGALNVSWDEGTGGLVPTSQYTARAYLMTCADPLPAPIPTTCLGTLVSQGTTTSKSTRLTGLTIGTRYGVQVTAYSGTGTPSSPSAIALGIPINAFDYWEKYKAMGGLDEGGCGAGSAGVLSLLAVAGLVRSLRRRP